jgi:hypothetical protein
MTAGVGTGRNEMEVTNECGEGRLSSIFWILVLVAAVYAAVNVGPVYYANYSFSDKMIEVARLPKWSNTDAKLMDHLMKEVRDEGLGPWVGPSNCTISTYEGGRRITCHYERTVNILPGFPHTFRFTDNVEQPLVY